MVVCFQNNYSKEFVDSKVENKIPSPVPLPSNKAKPQVMRGMIEIHIFHAQAPLKRYFSNISTKEKSKTENSLQVRIFCDTLLGSKSGQKTRPPYHARHILF